MATAAYLLVFFYLSDVFLWFMRNISSDLGVPGLNTVFTSEVRLWPFLAGRAGWKRSWALLTPNFLICSLSGFFYTSESSSWLHIRITRGRGGECWTSQCSGLTLQQWHQHSLNPSQPTFPSQDPSENEWLNDFKGPLLFCHFMSSSCPNLKLRFLFF